MPGIFRVKGLEERKRRLVQQSDIYREMIRGDVQNLKLSALHFQKKISLVRRSTSLLPLIGAVMGIFAWRRRRKVSPMRSAVSLIGGQLLRQILPLGGGFIAQKIFARHSNGK